MPKLLLNRENHDSVCEVLRQAGLLNTDESITRLSIPGDGNMNFTVRAETSLAKSFIVKQAREYVEKYPSIPAPVERSTVEARFYEAVQSDDVLRSYT
ncbi:MAG: aminoglycoside phosphotransferase, partial [Planctomycetota bacterium]